MVTTLIAVKRENLLKFPQILLLLSSNENCIKINRTNPRMPFHVIMHARDQRQQKTCRCGHHRIR